MSEMLFVTNRNKFTHQDRYDGQDYLFSPGEKVMITEDAAKHMFGLGLPDKSPIMHRNGWAMKYDPDTKHFIEDPTGVEKLKNFVFTKAVIIEKPAEEVPVE